MRKSTIKRKGNLSSTEELQSIGVLEDEPSEKVLTKKRKITEESFPDGTKSSKQSKSKNPCQRASAQHNHVIHVSGVDCKPKPHDAILPLLMTTEWNVPMKHKLIKERKGETNGPALRRELQRHVTTASSENIINAPAFENVVKPAPLLSTSKRPGLVVVKRPSTNTKAKPTPPASACITWSIPPSNRASHPPHIMALKAPRALHKWIGMASRIQIQILPNNITVLRLYRQKGSSEHLLGSIVTQ